MARNSFFGAFAIVASFAMACSAQNDEVISGNGDVPAGETPAPTEPPPPAPNAPPPATGETPKPPDLDLPDPNTPPPGPKERTILAIDEAGALVSFLAKDPSKVTTKAITGLQQGESILGIDVRPSNGMLYALGSKSRIYTIDRATGAATAVGNELTPSLQGQSFGFDFNPVADAIRIHSDYNQNLRVSPMTGAVVMEDKALTFAENDPNFLQDPNVVATAYTNSVSPKPAATDLYGIDSTRDLLVKVAPPNDGKVSTIGSLGVDVVAVAGFDIYGTGEAADAYAALHVDGAKMPALFAIDLTKGTATKVADIGHDKAIQGIAIEP